MITVHEICKQYAGKHALNGLSFTAANGSVLGFIGPNGAGKSTAMRIICGVMPPTSGSVSISGIDLNENPREAKEKIGYLPENAPLYTGMNVTAFLRYCGGMRGLSGKALDAAVAESVDAGSVWHRQFCTSRRIWCSTSRPTDSIPIRNGRSGP